MADSKASDTTRDKILEAACRVFGTKGYRDATVAEICRLARANIAAVNYHFGSKAELYRAVWQHGVEKAEELYPLDGGLPPSPTTEDRLRAFVAAMVGRKSNTRELAYFHHIRMSEMYEPTGAITDVMASHIQRNRAFTHALLREMLGPKATERDVEMCEVSVISQCFFRPPSRLVDTPPPGAPDFGDIQEQVAHITRFSLAGIEATRTTIEAR